MPARYTQLIFLSIITSGIVTVTVGKSKVFYLYSGLLITESDVFLKNLTGEFKEVIKNAIKVTDKDPDLFRFFVKYLYRDRSILSSEVAHYSKFVTLARLYTIKKRLIAPKF